MPEIKLKHVVSCSSEDSTHKADNLLSSDTYRKWKAARAGEKQVSVILQFEKEEQIHSIDIGNEGSAFIEVLVGHSTSVKDQDFEVLLVTSSFMSPTESRNTNNTNRVRFFSSNQFVKATAQEKWDRVKIVCSQPYSKTVCYGISFIKFHSPPDASESPLTTPPKLTKLGQFLVKDKSPASNLQPGSLFFGRDGPSKAPEVKVSPPNERLSYAAAALKSDGPATKSSSSSPGTQQAPVKRKFEFSKERMDAAAPPKKRPGSLSSTEPDPKTPKTKGRSSLSPSSSASPARKTPVKKESPLSKPESKPKTKPKPKSTEPVQFNRIMEGVVFVLSGFQNPFRAELRDKALAMGARYRPDWTPDSTHLICAFANTPKYSQVKSAGGVIVKKEWVLDCHKSKQKISSNRFLMDGAEFSSESEEEPDEPVVTKTPEKKPETPRKQLIKKEEEEDEEGEEEKRADDDGSGMDTEDELNRVEMENIKKKAAKTKTAEVKEEDPYGGSTDENTDAEEEKDKPIPELPDFLNGKRFYLYGKFPDNQKRLLHRYIIAFNGAVEDYMSEKVQFVITSEGWDESFEDALMENGNLSFVKPSWIFAINDRQKLLPYQPYTVVP